MPFAEQQSPPSTSLPSDAQAQAEAPPTPASTPERPGDAPWLHLDFTAEEASLPLGTRDNTARAQEPDGQFPNESLMDDGSRLITGVQGLLAPIRVATNIRNDDPVAPVPKVGAGATLGAEELRQLRTLLGARPKLTAAAPHPHARPPRGLRNPWLFGLLALFMGVAVFFADTGPQAAPAQLPGVAEAYSAIHNLPTDLPVVVYWAYDPAGAGELDLVMQPVLRHLLLRRARLSILSPLPGGPATAQRLADRVRTGPRPSDLNLAANLALPIETTYVPGGASVLALVARSPASVGAPDDPALVVVVAAQAEEVQNWLEQVQPLLPVPVVAVTAAGADPIVRPYRDSGQLVGLVSGFDGGSAYWRLLEPSAFAEFDPALNRHIGLQNWGQAAALLAILLGNLAALVGREPGA